MMVQINASVDRVEALARSALASGGRLTALRHVEARYGGNCSRPIDMQFTGRPLVGRPSKAKLRWRWSTLAGRRVLRHVAPRDSHIPRDGLPMFVDLEVRCRRCENCLRCRQRCWQARALAEVRQSARTWFGTLTLRPEAYYELLCQAQVQCRARGVDYETLSSDDKFRELNKVIFREITLWQKRVRRYSGAKLRFLVVAEVHKSGRPHYHLLVHEVEDSVPVRWELLTKQWRHGFVQFKLMHDIQAAAYICKYLGKEALARVRASRFYGKETREAHREVNPLTSREKKALLKKKGGNPLGRIPVRRELSFSSLSISEEDCSNDLSSSISQVGASKGAAARLSTAGACERQPAPCAGDPNAEADWLDPNTWWSAEPAAADPQAPA